MRIIFFVLFTLMISSCVGLNDKALEATADSKNKIDKIDQYLTVYEDEKEFSGFVLISSPDEIIYQRGFGYANYNNQEKNSIDTVYRIGSITKMMTSVAILKCQERGYLQLDDTIDNYIPEYVKGDQVTIRHLLSNTSGIPDWSVTLWSFMKRGKPYSFDHVLTRINKQELKYQPGADWNYSNPNFILAGEIIERVSGVSIGNFFKNEIFLPLNMNKTGFGQNGKIGNEAKGYSSLSPIPRVPRKLNHEFSYAAGNVYSTPLDMIKWLSALHSDSLLNKEQKNEMFFPYGQITDNIYYGFGSFIGSRKINGKDWNFISHSGGVTGFSCIVTLNEETGIMVIILGNYRNILDIYKEEVIEGDLVRFLFEDL
jgi:CubicO group peptidase (beta-lactamase class C family)